MDSWSLIRLYGLMTAVFFAIDIVWITVVAKSFYQEHLAALLRPDVVWPAALLFYAIYLAGILVFAVMPALNTGSAPRAIALGAFLGLFAYATFDLTSLALFRSFPVNVVVVDLAWGSVLTASVALAGFWMGRWLGVGAPLG